MEQKTKIVALEGKQELVIERDFELPVELLFQAHTDSELLAQWMGTKVLKLDCRNHGSFEIQTSYNDKVVFKANGTFHSIIPNQRIVRTFEIENMGLGIQLEFLDFERLTEHTSRLTMQLIFKSVAHREEQLKLPFGIGINLAHNRLEQIFNNKYQTNEV